MDQRRTSILCAAAVAVAMVPDTLRAQGAMPEGAVKRPDGSVVYPATPSDTVRAPDAMPEGAVKRPDGSVVYPPAPSDSGSRRDWWQRETDARAAERERYHLEAEAARQQRAEQILRDREASQSSPARQIPPSQKNY